jgi:hypothetical protein
MQLPTPMILIALAIGLGSCSEGAPLSAGPVPDRERHASPRRLSGGGGVECTVAQTVVAPRKEKGTATTSTADTPRRSPPRAVGSVRPLICSAN